MTFVDTRRTDNVSFVPKALHELFAGSSIPLQQAWGNITVTWTGNRIGKNLEFFWSEAVNAEHDDVDEFSCSVLKKVSPLSLDGVAILSITEAGWQWSLSTSSNVVFAPQIVDPADMRGP